MTLRKMRVWAAMLVILGSRACAAFAAQKAPDRVAQGKSLVTALTRGDYAAVVKTFDDATRRRMPEQRLKETWTGFLGVAGEFKKQESARMEKLKQDGKVHDWVVVRCQFAKMKKMDVIILYTAQGKVGSLSFGPPWHPRSN